MALYVDLPTFRALSSMPGPQVDMFEANNPGFVAARSAFHQARLDARLAKRYAVPFTDPVPAVVVGWIVDLITPEVYARRGYDASLAELEPLKDAQARALADIQEAADSEKGLFDLPLFQGGPEGVSLGGPLMYSETSPYVHLDVQRDLAQGDDERGRGL